YLDKLLKNPFYHGMFYWQGKLYPGTHTPLISRDLFERVQAVFQGHHKPKYQKHAFAFGGLLRCAYDDCAVTAEIKKNRYTYYRCTGYRGKCELPYFREEELGNRLGEVLKNIHIPNDILAQLQHSLFHDKDSAEAHRNAETDRLKQRLSQVRNRIEQAYLDKLDGKITEEFWNAKSSAWAQEEQQILTALQGLQQQNPERMLNGVRALELANKAHFLYLSQPPQEKAKLLRIVLSNCSVDAANVYPTYRKPFDVIFRRAKNKEWCARGDSNTGPSGS
ncbi:MAG: recombinase zinc beta ribbon domain-containing protein, partial [Candidatus Acidiferrales bacterium]